MDRRAFVKGVTGSLIVAANFACAQALPKVPRVGILHSSPAATFGSSGIMAIRNGLRDLGYVEGQSVLLEFRSPAAGAESLPGYASEIVRLNADVIIAIGPTAVRAAREATTVLPIVAMDLETDPVASGFARSLGRPAGNITGIFMDSELAGTWLGLLRAVAPKIQLMGVLWDSGSGSAQLDTVKVAAQDIAVKLLVLESTSANDFDMALDAGLKGGATALVILSSPVVGATVNSKRIAAFATGNRLPAISPFRSFTEAGGLMSYGPSILDVYRDTSTFTDKILKGAKPGDLPIEPPNKYELVINRKTAKTLGLAIPQSLEEQAVSID